MSTNPMSQFKISFRRKQQMTGEGPMRAGIKKFPCCVGNIKHKTMGTCEILRKTCIKTNLDSLETSAFLTLSDPDPASSLFSVRLDLRQRDEVTFPGAFNIALLLTLEAAVRPAKWIQNVTISSTHLVIWNACHHCAAHCCICRV